MQKFLKNHAFWLLLFASQFVAAQEDEGPEAPPGWDPGAPIDGFAYPMILAGLVLAFFLLRNRVKASGVQN